MENPRSRKQTELRSELSVNRNQLHDKAAAVFTILNVDFQAYKLTFPDNKPHTSKTNCSKKMQAN